eukprot:scaffold1787_cov159-Amphora_coffeaeformis.AAC.2
MCGNPSTGGHTHGGNFVLFDPYTGIDVVPYTLNAVFLQRVNDNLFDLSQKPMQIRFQGRSFQI